MSARVVQWGTGLVGAQALGLILDRPDLELAGVVCFTSAKAGLDAGTIAGRAEVGVLATTDHDLVEALRPDCVVFMPRDDLQDPTLVGRPEPPWLEVLLRILGQGIDVVSPILSPMHWRQLAVGDTLRRRIDAACARGGSSVFFTGVSPGFFDDCLVICMSSVVSGVTEVRMTEDIDFSSIDAQETYAAMGFGEERSLSQENIEAVYRPSWGGSLWLVADALDVTLDEILVEVDTRPAVSDYVSPGGFAVPAGKVGAIDVTLTGLAEGRPLVVNRHIARMGSHMAPDWPRVGERGGYRVEVSGQPPFVGEFPLGLPGGTGTCVGDAIVMTAARCVNAIPAVIDSAPGYHLLNDMPLFGSRRASRNP
jgi:4-hydroxy-tetrahydrodipicolinate reductase